MTTSTATDTRPIADRRDADKVAATGTLTVYVPHSTWGYLTDDRRAEPAALAARVRDYISATLIPEANKIMNLVCTDAGTRFTPDPFRPDRDADRHGFAVHGRLILHAPRTWGEMLVDADHPRPPGDDEIAIDLAGFAREVLNEKFGDHLSVLCPGAGVWISTPAVRPARFAAPAPSVAPGLSAAPAQSAAPVKRRPSRRSRRSPRIPVGGAR